MENENHLFSANVGDGFYNELWRPQYHFSAKQCWVNDPNGLVYYKGVYHLYYQCVPDSNECTSGDMHWGHATSTDLIRWTEHQPVLFPDKVGKMWSGTGAVDKYNTSGFFGDTEDGAGIVIAYSTNTQHIGIAYSKDGGFTFTKVSETEPVVAHPEGVTEFRDPHIFYYPEDKKWKMVVAGGLVRIYESEDLVHWTACGEAQEEYRTECPNLIRMKVVGTDEEKWVLSLGGRGYVVGSFDGKRFSGETDVIDMNDGPDTYAGITFSDMPDGRTVMISWMNRWWYAKNVEGIWSGCFALPVEQRLFKIKDSYRLIQTPVKEVETLRRRLILEEHNKVYSKGEDPLAVIRSNTCEILLTLDFERSSGFEIDLCVGDGDRSSLRFIRDEMRFVFDRSESRLGIQDLKVKFNPREFIIPRDSIKDGLLSLRLFIDKANVELYVNGGYNYFVERIQPSDDSRGMSLSADGSIAVESLQIYELDSIWNNK